MMRISATIVLVALVASVGLPLYSPAPASSTQFASSTAAGVTYFVDNREGCSVDGPGTSRDAPLCGFDRFADAPLGPGDELLIARGTTFAGPITLRARGTEDARVLIDAYGDGADPRFVFGDNPAILLLKDPTFTTVRHLDIGSKTETGRSAASYGLRVDFSEKTGEGLIFENLSVHDNRVVGLFVRNLQTLESGSWAARGVTLRNIDVTGNGHGISFANQGTVTGAPEQVTRETMTYLFRDVVVENSRFVENDNNNGDPAEVPAQIDAGCPDSLSLAGTLDAIVRSNIFDGAAGCRTTAGTAAVYLSGQQGTYVVNNVFLNTPNTRNPDMVAIDHEAHTSEVTIAGNYFADNYGGGIEYLAIHGAKDWSTENVVDANVFLRNGYEPNIPYLGGGGIAQVGNSIIPDTTVTNNIWHEPHGLLTAHLGGSTEKFTVSDNTSLQDPEWVSFAARDFGTSGSPWTYERSTATGWSALPAKDGRFEVDGVSIDAFALTPSAASAAALGWVAPRSGTVAIRGFAMPQGSDATLTVLRGEQELAKLSAPAPGAALVLNDVTVAAGDVIRFVAEDGKALNLTPSVSFLGAASSGDGLGEWNFSMEGDGQGWTSQADAAITGGSLALPLNKSARTVIDSAGGLGIDASSATALRLRIANRSAVASGRLYAAGAGEDFTEDKSVSFAVEPRTTRELAEGFTEVLVDVADLPGWNGKIDKLRIAFGATSGEVLIDSIQFASPSGPRWDFDSAEGWTYAKELRCPGPGTAPANPVKEVDNTAGTWRSTSDIAWNFARKQTFTVPSGTLAQLDLWVYKKGAPEGCLFLRIVDDASKQLFVGAVSPSKITTDGGFVSIFPQLAGLDSNKKYAVEVFSPYVTNADNAYGVNFADDSRYTSGEYYSVNAQGSWVGAEGGGARSLRFATYSTTTVTANDPWPPAVEAPITNGVVRGESGYDPALFSPEGLGIDASSTTKVHIRMTNPDNRAQAYLLFTTEDQPALDVPSGGSPPREETDGRGVAFALKPGPEMHEYVIDMAELDAWNGTIDRLIVQPNFRWNYRITSLAQTWNGAIDRIWLDDSATTATAPPQ